MVSVRRKMKPRRAGAWSSSSSSLMRLGGGGGGGGDFEGLGGGGEGGIVAAAADATVLNVSTVLASTPSIVLSSSMGSMLFVVWTPVTPSALSEFAAAVSAEPKSNTQIWVTYRNPAERLAVQLH